MELDAVHERVLSDRPGVCGAPTERLAVGFAGSSYIVPCDRCERDEFYGVDLDRAETDPVATAWLDPWPLPQPDRERDIARQHVVAQLAAELHTRDASGYRRRLRRLRSALARRLLDRRLPLLTAANAGGADLLGLRLPPLPSSLSVGGHGRGVGHQAFEILECAFDSVVTDMRSVAGWSASYAAGRTVATRARANFASISPSWFLPSVLVRLPARARSISRAHTSLPRIYRLGR
jgi:hypothetical protein